MSKNNEIKITEPVDFTDRKQLRLLIPRGFCRLIATKAKVTPKVVSEYFSYKSNNIAVETEILETIAELRKNKRGLIKKIVSHA